MGRQSAEAGRFAVVAGNFGGRPEPPKELTAKQADIWRETCASEHAASFATAALRELLKDYCRHKATVASLTQQINEYLTGSIMAPDVLRAFDRLTKIRDREARAAADKATKLRLTNQSRYTPKAAGTASKAASVAKKPWE